MEEINFRNDIYAVANTREIGDSDALERLKVGIVNRLFQEVGQDFYPSDASSYMIRKLSRFLDRVEGDTRYEHLEYHFEPYIDRVLSIRFPYRHDLSMSIYFDGSTDDCNGEDVEEAVLISRVKGELSMFSGTIEDVLAELDDML